MPLIPQFRAEGPATAQRPAMERERRSPRVDASEALRGIARLSGAVEDGGEIANIDPNLGQASAAGVAAIGEGIEDVGGALYDIEMRVLEAKNYADEHDAQIEMDREVLRFEEWKADNPNPESWEPAWRERMQNFGGQYFAGKNLSPNAEVAIRRRMESFTEGRAINVGMDAMRTTVKKAQESLYADILRARSARDYKQVESLTAYGEQRGWIAADRAEAIRIQARDEIQARTTEDALNYANAFAMRGMLPEAREQLVGAGLEPSELAEQMARFETVTAAAIETEEAYTVAAESSPVEVAQNLDAKDEYGNFTHFPHIKGTARQKLASDLWGQHYAEKSQIADYVKEGLANGSFQSLEQIEEQFDGFELSEMEKRTYQDQLSGQYVKDEGYVQAAVIAVAGYDPATDPLGIKAGSMASEYQAVLGDDPRLGGILSVLEKRRNGESLTMEEETKANKLREAREVIEAGGTWKRDAKAIEVYEKDGVKTYFDTSVEIKEGEPGYFETEPGFFDLKGKSGRIVQLSQEDRAMIDSVESSKRKGMVEDILTKNKELAPASEIISSLERSAATGQISTGAEWDDEFKRLILPEADKSSQLQIERDSQLFPEKALPEIQGSNEDMIRDIKKNAAMMKAKATF
jgi:hypothetical protein